MPIKYRIDTQYTESGKVFEGEQLFDRRSQAELIMYAYLLAPSIWLLREMPPFDCYVVEVEVPSWWQRMANRFKGE